MMRLIRITSVVVFGLFLFQNVQAKTCFNTNDINAEIIDASKSKNGEVDELHLSIKGTKEQNIFIPLLEYTSLKDILNFRDIDFDGKKEVIVKYDNDSSHSTIYSILKIDCNKLIYHPIIPETGFYEIDTDKKELLTYFKDGHRIGEKKYCFRSKGYLCYESLALTEQLSLLKKYNQKGKIIYQGTFFVEHPELIIVFPVHEKAYLYSAPNKKTKMYLIKGDKVTLLDEKIDDSNQKWYFINYKGKKDLNMWIKAEAVDLEPKTETNQTQEKEEPKPIKKATPKEPELAPQTKLETPKPAEKTKPTKPAKGSISLALLSTLLGLLAWRLS